MHLLEEAECPTEIEVNGNMSNTPNDETNAPIDTKLSEEMGTYGGTTPDVKNIDANEIIKTVDTTILQGNTDDSNIVDLCEQNSIEYIDNYLEAKYASNNINSEIYFDKENDLNIRKDNESESKIDSDSLSYLSSDIENGTVNNMLCEENKPANIDREENDNSILNAEEKKEIIYDKTNQEEKANNNLEIEAQSKESCSVRIDEEGINTQNKANSPVPIILEENSNSEIGTQNKTHNIEANKPDDNGNCDLDENNEDNEPSLIVKNHESNNIQNKEITENIQPNEDIKNKCDEEIYTSVNNEPQKTDDLCESDKYVESKKIYDAIDTAVNDNLTIEDNNGEINDVLSTDNEMEECISEDNMNKTNEKYDLNESSVVSKVQIEIDKEQTKIANCLTTIDDHLKIDLVSPLSEDESMNIKITDIEDKFNTAVEINDMDSNDADNEESLTNSLNITENDSENKESQNYTEESHKCREIEIDENHVVIHTLEKSENDNVDNDFSLLEKENRDITSHIKLEVCDSDSINSAPNIEHNTEKCTNIKVESNLEAECSNNFVIDVNSDTLTPKTDLQNISQIVTDSLKETKEDTENMTPKLEIIDNQPRPSNYTEIMETSTTSPVNNLNIIDEDDDSDEIKIIESNDDIMVIEDDSQDETIRKDAEVEKVSTNSKPDDTEDLKVNKDTAEKIKLAILNDFDSDEGEIIFEDTMETTADITNEDTTITSKEGNNSENLRSDVEKSNEPAIEKAANNNIILENESVHSEENREIGESKQSESLSVKENALKETKILKKSLKKMTRQELEQFCLRKIVETLQSKINVGSLEGKIEKLTEQNEEWKTKYTALRKQSRDLNIVVDKLTEDLKKKNAGYVAPMRITRSVGLQVIMYSAEDSSTKNLNNDTNDTRRMLPDKELNLEYHDNLVPIPPGLKPIPTAIREYSYSIDKETEVDANNEANTPTPKIIPKPKSVPVTPEPTPVQPKFPNLNGHQQSSNTDKRPLTDTVTVDLTDDEPPAKQMKLVQRTPVPNNSPRKLYIPIAGPRATRPFMGTQLRSPVGVRLPTNIQLKPAIPRHPGPLPEAKRVNTPGYKLIPPAPDLKISKVENGIVVSWKIDGFVESRFEEIASYQLFAYQETAAGPSTSQWKKIGDVKALPLPMACTLTQFTSGYKYYFAVRAVDVRSRIGPFSLPGSILLLNK